MYDTLIAFFNKHLDKPLTESEIISLREIFTVKRMRKHMFFLQEGEVCQMVGFVTKGAFRQYTIDESGKESILNLFLENWWVADRESFADGTPSPYFIDACEDGELLVFTREDFFEKIDSLPFLKEVSRKLTERNSYQLLKRVHHAKALSAEERLVNLEETYPEFLQRFPQHMIASYLGMTKETLSRIRAKHAAFPKKQR
ncbi:Crp/Fnr family transcriptional regulator [Persicitalea jodogahamensis]|uniref:cAMP-binding protein n=1 Tax=Persicitalea jodogahamensis TaxID=402147 RepID=A0A8J3GB91_9BACT|nr:Crp/Fnr family transcriptional regulator [Persicitalea jodogahamensis]GHB80163.1 cAMP-binding protein [Persicitalea jodogahamensis]